MSITADKTRTKSVSEIRNVAVSFLGKLDDSELLTGTPVITELTTSDLSFSDVSINGLVIYIEGIAHEAGQSVVYSVSGGVAGTTYTMQIECDTDGSPAQTLRGRCLMYIEAD